MAEILDEAGHLESTTLGVFRTAATVKGGRRFSFSSLVVVGDRQGNVGYGYGKANEVPSAIEKAQKEGRKSMKRIALLGGTIPHQVTGRFGASQVRLIPASPGTGVVAGAPLRAILEMVGVTDCLTKCYGSTNVQNVVKAAMDGLLQLQQKEDVGALRGVEIGKTVVDEMLDRGKAYLPSSTEGERLQAPVNVVGNDRRGGGRGGRRGGGGGRGRGGAGGPPPAAKAAPESTPASSASESAGGDAAKSAGESS